MNKRELVARVARSTGLEKKTVRSGLEAILSTVRENLRAGGKVKLVGFGTFRTACRKPRPAINLQTMEKVILPERRVVTFSPGSTLKQTLNHR
ncbi:MAG: HU family DNA-binding protein [Clostridia bacterium]|nr:HU family DNA-binding protein [Clostridia bacterium]